MLVARAASILQNAQLTAAVFGAIERSPPAVVDTSTEGDAGVFDTVNYMSCYDLSALPSSQRALLDEKTLGMRL